MKKTLILTILGITAPAAVCHSEGYINFSNYLWLPYAQVVWDPSVPGVGGWAVTDPHLTFQVFYGEGTLSDSSSLTPGPTFHINPAIVFDAGAGHGPGGYFGAHDNYYADLPVMLPDWVAGDTYTFMYKVVTPGYSGQSVLWQEGGGTISSEIQTFGFNTGSYGLVVSIPEPSTSALLLLGAYMIARAKRVRTLLA